MTASYFIDDEEIDGVRRGEVELTQTAELGNIGTGRFKVNDQAGTLAIIGQKDVAVDEDACSDPIAYRGFVAERTIERGKEATGPSREIDVALEDDNAVLGFRGITGDDRKRKRESVAARGAWLMASDYLDGLVVDNGRCEFSATKGMDAADYTDQYPGDVLADMALAQGGIQFYVRTFDAYVGRELVFRNDNTSEEDTSTIHVSNVPGEADHDTIFYPSKDFALRRNPAKVKSKIAYQHAKGRIVEERSETAEDFNGERFGVASNSNVKTDDKARDNAREQLWQLHTEEDVLEGEILVPRTHANLIGHGDRVGVRLEHMTPEGYFDAEEWKWCRVLELTRRPLLRPVSKYALRLKLSPQESAPPAAALVQYAVGRGTAYGLDLTLANPVTIGNTLICFISTKQDQDPEAPNTDAALPRWGAGAWTRVNGSQLHRAQSGGITPAYGISAYYKTADATTQTGHISELDPTAIIYELSGADPASMTIEWEDATIGGPNYDIGTQTPAVGDVALAAWCMGPLPAPASYEWAWDYSNSYPWQTPNPNPGISAGWTLDWSKWKGDGWSLSAYLPSSPWTVFAHADGAGSALLARVTPGESGHPFGALYLKIPPL